MNGVQLSLEVMVPSKSKRARFMGVEPHASTHQLGPDRAGDRFYTNAMHTGAGLSSFTSVGVSAPVFRSILWTRVTLVFCPSVKT